MPKELGGWSIKNLIWFSKSLAEKSLWRLMHKRMLWGKVMISKYMTRKSIEEWFWMPRKVVHISYTWWKVMADSFPLMGVWIVWWVGNGRSIQIGEDHWEGSYRDFKLSKELVDIIHNMGVYSLRDATSHGMDISRHSIWNWAVELSLEGFMEEEWNKFIGNLKSNFISLEEDEDDSFF